MKKSMFPDWSSLTPEKAAADLPRLLEEAEKGVAKIEASSPQTFEDLEWALADATRPLWDLWGMVGHMMSVMNSDEWRKVDEEFRPKIVEFSLRVSQSKRLNDLAKEVLMRLKSCGGEGPNATKIRILEKSIQGAELSGVSLEGEKKKRFNEISQRLSKLSMDYSNAVLDATNAFKFEKDGKTYTIDDANYPQTMKHCADREVREKLFRARSTRAPENTARIDEILALRFEKAKLLGFRNPAELSIAVKSAPSVAAVMKMIDDLDAATEKIAAEEKAELVESAKGAVEKLEPWDQSYYATRLRESKYSYSEEELKKYFEVEDVVAGLFKMANFLYNVDIRELKGDEKPSVWHPDVRFFEVSEGGKPIAHFYFDPYVRNGQKRGGAWMNSFEDRCDRRGVLPLALVVTNFPQPDENGKSYLPMREVETVFHEFGHATQCMFTRIGEEGAAGLSLVEWDAVEVASQFNENWCLDGRPQEEGARREELPRGDGVPRPARARQDRHAAAYRRERRQEAPRDQGGDIPPLRHADGKGGSLPLRVRPHLRGRIFRRLLRLQVGRGDERRLLRRVRGGGAFRRRGGEARRQGVPRHRPRARRQRVGLRGVPAFPRPCADD